MKIPSVFSVLIIVGIFVSCSGYSSGKRPLIEQPLSVETSQAYEPLKINVISVLPIEFSQSASEDLNDPANATIELIKALELETSLDVVNARSPKTIEEALPELRSLPVSPREKALRLGRRTASQGVIYGVVNDFRASDGSGLGSSTPASVSFKLWLIDAESGSTLWTANYNHSQQPLTENLLRLPDALSSGVKYRSREELLVSGFQDAGKSIEQLRVK